MLRMVLRTSAAVVAVCTVTACGSSPARTAERSSRGEQPATRDHQRTAPVAGGQTYLVKSGDTLSEIAADQRVAGGWQALYEDNRQVVGADPGLIFPGQRLSL